VFVALTPEGCLQFDGTARHHDHEVRPSCRQS
jgi:hypothetical protein